jgi:hypothetical protein
MQSYMALDIAWNVHVPNYITDKSFHSYGLACSDRQ